MARNDENIFAEERKQMIVELVNRQVKATVASLCEEFGVSPPLFEMICESWSLRGF